MASRPIPDPGTMAANWVAGMSSAQTQTKYKTGVQQTTESPMAKAATPAALQAYADGCARSVSSGKRAASLNNTPISVWQQGCLTKGASALATGAKLKQAKFTAAMQAMAPRYAAARAAAAAIGRVPGDVANAQARASAAIAALMS